MSLFQGLGDHSSYLGDFEVGSVIFYHYHTSFIVLSARSDIFLNNTAGGMAFTGLYRLVLKSSLIKDKILE